MNKKDLIDQLAEQSNLSKKDAENFLANLASIAKQALVSSGEFTLPDVCTLHAKDREARTGRNPRTGESIQIAATRTVGLKNVAKHIRDKVAAGVPA
jgi:DNA-binding protein HU-beta